MAILEVKNLTKKFGKFSAVDVISFALEEGEILGFLGQNGAGKTTTIQMLLGVLKPTAGNISYFGKDFQHHREEILERVNFSSTYTNLMWWLTVKENLTFISYLYQIPNRKKRIKEIVEIFRLEELLNQELTELSAGQLTRVNLAKAFLNFPKILLLDEPTASLDPEVAQYIREFLLEERKKFGVSIIITSHNMGEVEELCDRVVVLHNGKIIANDTPSILAGSIEKAQIEFLIKKGEKEAISFWEKDGIEPIRERNLFKVAVSVKDIPQHLQELTKHGVLYSEINIEKPTLEDYFLQVVEKHI